MVDANRNHRSVQPAQQLLSTQLLKPILTQRRPQRVLVMQHANAEKLLLETLVPTQLIRLCEDQQSPDATLRCRLDALAFEDDAFDLIVMHHLISNGSEAMLAEALRVLAPGGDVVISGLNSTGLLYRLGNRQNRFPGIRLDRVLNQLKTESFEIRECILMGLAGLSRPAPKVSWHGLGLPFADRVALHAHHQFAPKATNVLRFKQVQRAGLASAALDGCNNRSAAS